MGSGIAAQFANAGVPVVLLDVVPAGASNRSVLAESAIARQLKVGGFMHPDQAALVTPGNIDDHLGLVADADWIVEAVVENEAIKHDIYQRLDAVRKSGSMVSSNTSTIPRAQLIAGLGERFAGDFVVSHFFNPPRYMRLLEIVSGADTRMEIVERVRLAGDIVLGKTVINCRDTPGFVANRVGCYWMSVAALEAIALGLSVEEADAIAGPPFGVPATGIFGLIDLVGLDLIPSVWASLRSALPADDPFQVCDLPGHAVLRRMVAEGRLGRKAGAGFYRMGGQGTSRNREVYDLASASYRPAQPVTLESVTAAGRDLARLCEFDDRGGRYAWRVLSRVLCYAARVGPEIADDIATIDLGMQLGYNWAAGPFALADRVGVARIAERLAADGEAVPELLAQAVSAGGFYQESGRRFLGTDGRARVRQRPQGVLTLADAIEGRASVAENASAALWDIGNGVACLELRTKLNVIDERVIEFIERLPHEVPRGFRALVVGGCNSRAFSAGANLEFFIGLIERGEHAAIERFIQSGQHAFRSLMLAPFPVVAAVSGMALGGGCELMMHCSAAVVHAELMVGLPEARVGIVPGWGGCARMLARASAAPASGGGPAAVASRVFETLSMATLSRSALEAGQHGYLRATDTIVMNPDRVLAAARDQALAMAEVGYRPPEAAALALPGRSARMALVNFVHGHAIAGRASKHDEVVAGALATVLTGGEADPLAPVAEERVYRLECEAVLALTDKSETLARMRHMLATGKPLRN